MFKTHTAKVIVTVVSLAAGAAQAASVFPSSANEVSGAWYAGSIEGSQRPDNRTASAFPSSATEHAMSAATFMDYVRGNTSIAAGRPSAVPSSANETKALAL